MTMLERIARALETEFEAQRERFSSWMGATGPLHDEEGQAIPGSLSVSYDGDIDLRALARVAVAAMREPDDAMQARLSELGAATITDEHERGFVTHFAVKAHRAMIDAIIQEK